jgi:hypothetical protein
VVDDSGRDVDAAVAEKLTAERQVNVLAVHEEVVLEQADVFEHRSAVGCRAGARPEHELLAGVLSVVRLPDPTVPGNAVHTVEVACRVDDVAPVEQQQL